LAETPGIVGVKQAVGGIDADTLALLAGAPDWFSVLAGDDAFILPLLLMGGAGAIAASANVCTERFAALVADRRVEDAEALLPLVRALFAEPSPAVIKAVLHAEGRIPTPDVRMPLTPASPASLENTLSATAVLT
jgi:4-hydroxy-tetrahydrodipicolinate synthase